MPPEYYAWYNMHARCYNPRVKNFHNYGGRGIQVCAEWGTYAQFLLDMGKRPSKVHSLDRKNNDGNYGPSNCRWTTPEMQTANRRDSGTHKVQSNNKSGLIGVTFAERQGRWAAIIREYGAQVRLYWGKDFFEACCARKSWEANHART